jgi:hypothetical protein
MLEKVGIPARSQGTFVMRPATTVAIAVLLLLIVGALAVQLVVARA